MLAQDRDDGIDNSSIDTESDNNDDASLFSVDFDVGPLALLGLDASYAHETKCGQRLRARVPAFGASESSFANDESFAANNEEFSSEVASFATAKEDVLKDLLHSTNHRVFDNDSQPDSSSDEDEHELSDLDPNDAADPPPPSPVAVPSQTQARPSIPNIKETNNNTPIFEYTPENLAASRKGTVVRNPTDCVCDRRGHDLQCHTLPINIQSLFEKLFLQDHNKSILNLRIGPWTIVNNMPFKRQITYTHTFPSLMASGIIQTACLEEQTLMSYDPHHILLHSRWTLSNLAHASFCMHVSYCFTNYCHNLSPNHHRLLRIPYDPTRSSHDRDRHPFTDLDPFHVAFVGESNCESAFTSTTAFWSTP
ncbi:hypothetical protein HDU98_001910 [Podochytrium sp. JEL0797]|nr:hypothetical protein HDU98_001910 [Podochytrium sp. JEL0797]